ncbi:MAG: hypothetical protein AAFY88_09460, partial [Acidobacteriota bacterium]
MSDRSGDPKSKGADQGRVETSAHALFERWVDAKIESGVEPDLDALCADEPELRPQVEALIRGFRALDMALPSPGGDGDASPAAAPTVLGYAVNELIGEGGMGEVWKAEQLEPVRRPVALKVIKPRPDLDRLALRFEFERQAQA